MGATHIKSGLTLDFTPAVSDPSALFLTLDPTGNITARPSIPTSKVTGAGNVTETTSAVLTITGGTGAVLTSGLTIQVKQASGGQAGYLSSADWTTFNSKLGTSLTSGSVFVGNGSNVATGVALTGSVLITNAGVTSIASGVIVNANINASAAIAVSKFAALTASLVVATDGSGFLTTVAGLTPTIAGYLTTLTSDAQTQINGKLSVTLTSPVSGNIITYNGSAWVNSATPAGTLPTGGSTGQFLTKNSGTNYDAGWHTLVAADISNVTSTFTELNLLSGVTTSTAQLNYLNTVTGNVQGQLDGKLTNSLAQNAIWIGNASSIPIQLAPGTTGYVLTSVSGVPQWQPSAGGGGGITGPGSSTNTSIVRWSGVLGTVVQDSTVLVDNSGVMTGGTWHGNKVGLAYGGTNADLSATGGASNYLKQVSSGAAITVGTIPASDISSGAALTKTDDTNVTLTLGGTPSTALLVASSLTLGWTGTLAYARLVNGAGLSVVGRSTNSAGVQADIVGVADQVLRVSGTSLAFGAINIASSVSVTGTLPIANGGLGITTAPATGNLLVGNSGSWNILATGTNGYVLTLSGGTAVWAAGGGGGGGNPFADNAALVKNNSDNTKLAILSASLIATSTTLTYSLGPIAGVIPIAALTFNSQAGNYTLSLTDYYSPTSITMTSGSPNNLTLPDDGTVAFPIGTQILVRQTGAGLTTFVAGGSSTVTSSNTVLTGAGQNILMAVTKTAANTWFVDNGTPSATYTPGSIIFAATTTGLPTQDNTNFFWDQVNHWLGIGTNVPAATLHVSTTVTSATRGVIADEYSAGTTSSLLLIRKSRSASFGGFAAAVSGDNLGEIRIQGTDGSGFFSAATIIGMSAATPSAGIVPGKLVFQTANTSGTLTTAATINDDQTVDFANSITVTSAASSSLNTIKIVGTSNSTNKTLALYQSGGSTEIFSVTDNGKFVFTPTVKSSAFNPTFTAAAASDAAITMGGTLTANSAGGVVGFQIANTLTPVGSGSVQVALDVIPTFTAAGSNPVNIAARFQNGGVLIGSTGYTSTELVGIRKDQNANTSLYIINNQAGTAAQSQIYMGGTGLSGLFIAFLQASFTTANQNIANTAVINGSTTGGLNLASSNGQVSIWSGSSNTAIKRLAFTTLGSATFTNSAGSGSAVTITGAIGTTGDNLLIMTPGAHTAVTASTALIDVSIGSRVVNWATGALATQFPVQIGAQTITFTGGSALTTTGAFYVVGAPIASNNNTTTTSAGIYIDTHNVAGGTGSVATSYGILANAQTGATSNYSAGFTGGLGILLSATNIVTDTTTGMKIGTSTSQKLAFFNATPIVQLTTAVAAATFVANTSLIANDTATWGGYTAGQIVQALKNLGFLA